MVEVREGSHPKHRNDQVDQGHGQGRCHQDASQARSCRDPVCARRWHLYAMRVATTVKYSRPSSMPFSAQNTSGMKGPAKA